MSKDFSPWESDGDFDCQACGGQDGECECEAIADTPHAFQAMRRAHGDVVCEVCGGDGSEDVHFAAVAA